MIIRTAPIIAAALLVAGCATSPTGYDPSRLTAEQLKAVVADKSTTVSCGLMTGTYGRGVVVYVNLDSARTLAHGTVTVDGECKTAVTIEPPAPAASAAKP